MKIIKLSILCEGLNKEIYTTFVENERTGIIVPIKTFWKEIVANMDYEDESNEFDVIENRLNETGSDYIEFDS